MGASKRRCQGDNTAFVVLFFSYEGAPLDVARLAVGNDGVLGAPPVNSREVASSRRFQGPLVEAIGRLDPSQAARHVFMFGMRSQWLDLQLEG